LQVQVDATIRIMRETINNLLEWKERLDLFENRTDRLFITSYSSYDKRKDIKRRMCLINSIIILLLIIIILLIITLIL
jgi:uncharacterized membrane protein YvbJ